MATAKTPKNGNPYRPNAWYAVIKIFLGAINKGQAPLLGGMAIVFVLVFKLPATDASGLLHDLLHLLESYHILGWILSLIITLAWVFTARFSRKRNFEEIQRMAEEKKKLQSHILGVKLPTSNK